mmetsp:Transcript_97786/g.280964  ORF Transcript_97786/g.280964 Transcript_97786/m.280964 type:complete len:206 (+) Transcript_97786:1489-2106(+)
MFTFLRPTPSTMLSMAMFASEAARMPLPTIPELPRLQWWRILTATEVLPVPGGPWTNTKDLQAAASMALIWLSFMPSAAVEFESEGTDAHRASAAWRALEPLVTTASTMDGEGLILSFRSEVCLPGMDCAVGAASMWRAQMTREYCCRFANLSMRNFPDSCVTSLGGIRPENLITKGRSLTTSASIIFGPHCQSPSGLTPTQSPF